MRLLIDSMARFPLSKLKYSPDIIRTHSGPLPGISIARQLSRVSGTNLSLVVWDMPLLVQMPAQLALAVRSSLEEGESVLFATPLGSRRALVLTSRRVLVTHRSWRGAHVKAIPYAQVDYVLDRRHSLELFANRAATRLVLPVPAEHFDRVRELSPCAREKGSGANLLDLPDGRCFPGFAALDRLGPADDSLSAQTPPTRRPLLCPHRTVR